MPGESSLEKVVISNQENIPGGTSRERSLENKIEQAPVKPENIPPPIKDKKSGSTPFIAAPQGDLPVKRAQEIDNILSEGLNDIFLKMDSQKQADFKRAGEETVTKINILLSETKIRVNKIIDLIKKWLKMIPGINKFFLEQEVKIKTDKIIKIKNKF